MIYNSPQDIRDCPYSKSGDSEESVRTAYTGSSYYYEDSCTTQRKRIWHERCYS